MELAATVVALGLGDSAAVLAQEWEASQASLPRHRHLLLDPDQVAAACHEVYLPPEIGAAAAAAARRIAVNPALQALAWHCRHCLFCCPTFPPQQIWCWPSLEAALQEDAGLFYLLVLLSWMPELRELYQEHAIPDQIARDTLFDIQRYLLEYYQEQGRWGLAPRRLTWLRNHLQGELYHLVRLQFQPGRFQVGVRVFRHRGSGTVVALSEDGVRYRADGQLDGAGGVVDPTGAWTARLICTEEEVIGSPVVPTGSAIRREIRLRRAEWQQVLAPGDPVLHIHIPAGSPMAFDLCGQSFAAALGFFPGHFPDRPFVAFACSSWLLDAQFEKLLPPSSNVVRFLREVYLLPGRSDGRGALARVFGEIPADLARVPRDTTLRRAIADHLLGGGHLRGGRCFLLPEDLHWGGQVYRLQASPW